jgi:Mg2+/Co2+ transporter CorB
LTKFSSKILKAISVALLLFFSLHSFSVHGFADSLIYCFESNGDINIESASSFSLGTTSDCDEYINDIHSETEAEYHSDSDHCFDCDDVEISETCIKENRVNRLDQNKTIEKIYTDLYQSFSFLPNSAKKQKTSFIPPNIEQQDLASLETVVLLN